MTIDLKNESVSKHPFLFETSGIVCKSVSGLTGQDGTYLISPSQASGSMFVVRFSLLANDTMLRNVVTLGRTCAVQPHRLCEQHLDRVDYGSC